MSPVKHLKTKRNHRSIMEHVQHNKKTQNRHTQFSQGGDILQMKLLCLYLNQELHVTLLLHKITREPMEPGTGTAHW